MLKKLLLVVAILCFIPSIGNATIFDTKVSGSTVTYSTVVQIMTFNTVTNWLLLRNESVLSDCYVFLNCNKGVAINDAVLKLPASGTQTPNTVTLNFSTMAIGFISDRITPTNSALNRISYTVTTDKGDF